MTTRTKLRPEKIISQHGSNCGAIQVAEHIENAKEREGEKQR